MESAAGEKLLKIYHDHNPPKLTTEGRHYLIDSIIKEYMDKDICMELEDFKKITKHITDTFPSEEGVSYTILKRVKQCVVKVFVILKMPFNVSMKWGWLELMKN